MCITRAVCLVLLKVNFQTGLLAYAYLSKMWVSNSKKSCFMKCFFILIQLCFCNADHSYIYYTRPQALENTWPTTHAAKDEIIYHIHINLV